MNRDAPVGGLFPSMLHNPDVYDPETANAGIEFLADSQNTTRSYSLLWALPPNPLSLSCFTS